MDFTQSFVAKPIFCIDAMSVTSASGFTLQSTLLLELLSETTFCADAEKHTKVVIMNKKIDLLNNRDSVIVNILTILFKEF